MLCVHNSCFPFLYVPVVPVHRLPGVFAVRGILIFPGVRGTNDGLGESRVRKEEEALGNTGVYT